MIEFVQTFIILAGVFYCSDRVISIVNELTHSVKKLVDLLIIERKLLEKDKDND
jgi:hypothetical protein